MYFHLVITKQTFLPLKITGIVKIYDVNIAVKRFPPQIGHFVWTQGVSVRTTLK